MIYAIFSLMKFHYLFKKQKNIMRVCVKNKFASIFLKNTI